MGNCGGPVEKQLLYRSAGVIRWDRGRLMSSCAPRGGRQTLIWCGKFICLWSSRRDKRDILSWWRLFEEAALEMESQSELRSPVYISEVELLEFILKDVFDYNTKLNLWVESLEQYKHKQRAGGVLTNICWLVKGHLECMHAYMWKRFVGSGDILYELLAN